MALLQLLLLLFLLPHANTYASFGYFVSDRIVSSGSSRPVGLIIMDGLAYGSGCNDLRSNAVLAANTPVLDKLWQTEPHTYLQASGEAVGLPAGQMGNSEVGHLNLGAGRCVHQELSRIDRAIADDSIFNNSILLNAIDRTIAQDKTIHFLGLLSDGGVHSHLSHLKAFIKLAVARGATDIAVHALLDGRDVPPTSGVDYLRDIMNFIADVPEVRLATVMGRYYGMDRDKRWDRTQRAQAALVRGEGQHVANSNLIAAVEDSYEQGVSDEFIEPLIIEHSAANQTDTTKVTSLADSDLLIMFNFRPDRARQIMDSLTSTNFTDFDRGATHPTINAVCLTEYDKNLDLPIAFPKEYVQETFADVLAAAGLTQLHIAETEKYAHVTFFFNGGAEAPKQGEARILVPSPQVATYDLCPQMSAVEITDYLTESVQADAADVYIVNYANGDMVGHTGDFDATVTAVETVDRELGRIVEVFCEKGGALLITADHGNAEQMLDGKNSGRHTAHTLNLVPLIAIGTGAQSLADGGSLADVAPTLAHILGIEPSKLWTGRNLMVN